MKLLFVMNSRLAEVMRMAICESLVDQMAGTSSIVKEVSRNRADPQREALRKSCAVRDFSEGKNDAFNENARITKRRKLLADEIQSSFLSSMKQIKETCSAFFPPNKETKNFLDARMKKMHVDFVSSMNQVKEMGNSCSSFIDQETNNWIDSQIQLADATFESTMKEIEHANFVSDTKQIEDAFSSDKIIPKIGVQTPKFKCKPWSRGGIPSAIDEEYEEDD